MSICQYFEQISIRKRFIYVFSATTLITILASIILIEVQLINITDEIKGKLSIYHQQDISNSTKKNLEALLISYQVILNSYANKIRQLSTSYTQFTANPLQNISLQNLTSPPNCSTLPSTPNYSTPCKYYFNGTQPYNNHSFFDVLLPTLLPYNQQYVKRINVIYFNTTSNNVTTVRTYPAAPIQIANLSQIQRVQRILRQGYINISSYYSDPFSSTRNNLVSLATVVNFTSDTQIILQIEMEYQTVSVLYSNVLYFPGSTVIYCYYNPNVTGEAVILLAVSENYTDQTTTAQNAYDIIVNNISSITVEGISYYSCFINFAQSLPIDLQELQVAIKNPQGNFYLIQLVPADQMNMPYDSMTTYIRKLNFIVGVSFGFTSVIALMTIISFSFMASNGISSRLNKISGSLNQYLHGVNYNTIIIKLKKLSAQNLIKRLSENIILLIRRVESNKAKFANTTETYKHQYPENDFDSDFLRRINSASVELWPAIEEKLEDKYSPKMKPEPQDKGRRR